MKENRVQESSVRWRKDFNSRQKECMSYSKLITINLSVAERKAEVEGGEAYNT